MRTVLEPKVCGAWVLHSIAQERPGCLFVSFSSVNGFFGGATVGAYAAASSFLDSFALYQRRHRAVQGRTISWSMWHETGMSAGYRLSELSEAKGYAKVGRAQGMLALSAALRNDEPFLLAGLDRSKRQMRSSIEQVCRPLEELVCYVHLQERGNGTAGRETVSVPDRFGQPVRGQIVELEEIPLTAGGQIDRDALRSAGGTGRAQTVEPRTDLERNIANVWREVLGVDHVGVHDNFFDLGGHSLRLVQMRTKLCEAMNRDVPVVEFFRNPTVGSLASFLSGEEQSAGADAGSHRAALRKAARTRRNTMSATAD